MQPHPLQSMAEESRALVLEAITEVGKPVSLKMVAAAIHLSEQSAKAHLKALVKEGKLRRVYGMTGGEFYMVNTQETLF